MTGELLLGVDVGTSRVKAQLMDADGSYVATGSAPMRWADSGGGRVEADVDVLLGAVRAAMAACGERRAAVAAVGIAGMAESGAGFGGDGRAVTAVIAWNDARGGDAVARLKAELGDDLDRWIGQRARTVMSAAKLGWLVDGGVRITRWLGVPELLLHALTGEAATEHSLAARTGCYDVAELRWRPEVADVLGFPIGVFPDVRTAGSVMGRITTAGAAWSGLPDGVPVTIAGHDHLAGAIGAIGARGFDRDLLDSVGTAETIVGVVGELPDLDAALTRRLAVGVFPGGTAWAVLGGAARAGVVVHAAAAVLGATPEELDALAEACDPTDAVDWVADLARGQAGAAPRGRPGEVWAGVLRALCLRTADAVERVTALVPAPDRLVVFGGGSRSRPWLRAKAAVVPLPIWRSSAVEAGSRGAAVVAGVAAGWWPDIVNGPRATVEAP